MIFLSEQVAMLWCVVVSSRCIIFRRETQGWASECPDVKNYKWRLNPVWHSCTYVATVGVKGLIHMQQNELRCLESCMVETSFAASKTNCSIIIGYRFYTDMHGFINLVTRKYSHFLQRDATSTVLLRQVVCPSFCPSVMLRYRGCHIHIGWNSSKIISRLERS